MLAAFPYTCPCGRWFVVGVDDEQRLGGWMVVMRDVATKLGAHVVDAAEPVFSCPGCGASHGRAQSRSTKLAYGPLSLVPEMS
jgi:predicted RNA-binding Zn-ribbon protein involved in translation (DUF1610 family)